MKKTEKQVKVVNLINDKILEVVQSDSIGALKPSKKYGDGSLRHAYNYFTDYKYNAVNQVLLPPSFYVTFAQIKKHGAKLKDGFKTYYALQSWSRERTKYRDKETGEEIIIPSFKYRDEYGEIVDTRISTTYGYEILFNIEDVENLPERTHKDEVISKKPFTLSGSLKGRNTLCDIFLNAYLKRENIETYEGSEYSFYSIKDDSITVKPFEKCENANDFYEQFFHEASHSTGHATRLNRKTLTNPAPFGSGEYSIEEIIAETSALYCLKEMNILTVSQAENCSKYIKHWLNTEGAQEQLKKEPDILIRALNQAERAYNYIFNRKYKGGESDEDN